jgi:hypothetical protein
VFVVRLFTIRHDKAMTMFLFLTTQDIAVVLGSAFPISHKQSKKKKAAMSD